MAGPNQAPKLHTDKEYKDSLLQDLRQIQQYLYDNSDAKIKNFKKYDHRGNN